MSVSVKNDGNLSVFTFKDVDNGIVNAFRRVILDDVPTFAIEDVEVVINESPIYDEALAHRLGLVPLKTDSKSYNLKSECKCSGVGCALCEVKLALAQEGEGFVYSSSIKSDDPKIVPAYDTIPVTKLFGNKKVELNLKAVLGTGREHAKWSPAHTYMRENGKDIELIIEPFGQLSAKDIYNSSIDVLIKKIDELEEGLK